MTQDVRPALTERDWQKFKNENWPADVPRECAGGHVWTQYKGVDTCVTCTTAVRLMHEFVTRKGV